MCLIAIIIIRRNYINWESGRLNLIWHDFIVNIEIEYMNEFIYTDASNDFQSGINF